MEIGGRFKSLYDILIALSLANLCFLTVWRELLFASPSDAYWIPDYTRETFVAIMVNVLALFIIILGAIRFLFQCKNKFIAILSRIGVLALLVFPLHYLRLVLGIDEHTIHWLEDHRWISLPMAIISAGLILLTMVVHLQRVTRAVGLTCLLFSPFALSNLLQAAWAASQDVPTQHRPRAAHSGPGNEAHQRVLWLLMDELDLRLAFLERPSGLSLPEFDRLRGQALFAHQAISYSRSTEEGIPSFLLQRIVDTAHPVGPASLHLTFMDFEELPASGFSCMSNVFSEASGRGMSTAIVGFYHPYCRLFTRESSYCRTYSMGTYTPYATDDLLAEMGSQIVGITPIYRRANAIRTYLDASEQLKAVVSNPDFDLIYVHASVPHGPNIWDAASESFTVFNTAKDGYFGNLILADRLLGLIRHSMEVADLWDSTVVILTSDHEWRHAYLYDGRRVRKIPFIVKMPGQQLPIDFKPTFAPMRVTKDLIVEIQNRSLETPQEVAYWLVSRGRELGVTDHRFGDFTAIPRTGTLD